MGWEPTPLNREGSCRRLLPRVIVLRIVLKAVGAIVLESRVPLTRHGMPELITTST
jgi:hypothetical protein